MSRKNRNFILESAVIEDYAAEGKCIARHEGEIIFVSGANVAKGDVVKLLVNNRKKRFSEAIVMQTLEYSNERIAPICGHFGICGGCKWQHIPYEKQLELKETQVYDQLKRIGKVEIKNSYKILGSTSTEFYRNKLEYSFSEDRWYTREEIETGVELSKNALGFHAPGRFDKVIDIDKCYLQSEVSNQIRNRVREIAKERNHVYYNHRDHVGFLRSLMIRSSEQGLMVVIQFADKLFEEIEFVLKTLKEEFTQITSLNYIINQKRNDTFFDLEIHNYAGEPFLIEEMEGLKFKVQPKSFFQTNSKQAYELYKITRNFANLKGSEVVYDLYTGTGTIAQFVANQSAKVIGIDYVEDAINDAKQNAIFNNIENVSFFAGDMKKVFTKEFVETNGHPDVVITDPPRAGMDVEVIDILRNFKPTKIVYVSCNPATQARDLALLDDLYSVEEVQPVDMFPHTHHVENVALLKLRQ